MRVIWGFICCLLLAGCATREPISENALLAATGAGTGAVAGYAIGNNSAAGAAIGATGGGLISQLFIDSKNQKLQAAYDCGYVQARSDAIKRHYWLKQQNERPSSDGSRMAYYSIPGSTQTPDGRSLVEHNVVIPILE